LKSGKIINLIIIILLITGTFIFGDDNTKKIIVNEIKINGLVTVPEKEVTDVISYTIGMELSKYKTREDIRNIYKTGKFDSVEIYTDEKDGKTTLVYDLKEKPKINKIIVKGNKDVGEGDIKGKLDDDKEEIKLKEGEFFDEYQLKRAIINIESMYKEKNFYYASVKYNVVAQPQDVSASASAGQKVNVEIIVDEGSKIKIKNIIIVGNNVFSADKVKSAMKTKEEGWFQSGAFDEDKFLDDLKDIISAYAEEGYVKAKVNGYTYGEIDINKKDIMEKDVLIDKATNTVTLKIPVSEGIKYTLTGIDIKGNEIYTTQEILGRIESKVGKPFNKNQFDKDIAAIRSFYADKGYIFASIKDSYVYDDDIGEVKVSIEIEEGSVAYINKIKIMGNYVTKEKVILRELLVHDGDPFDSTKIKRSVEKLYNLGFFDNIVPDTEQVDIDKLNVILEVKEKKTGTISLGAGYSSIEKLVGNLTLTEANLFGEGKSFSATIQIGSLQRTWQLTYKDPWLLDTPTSFQTDVWNTYSDSSFNNEGYSIDTYGFDVSLGKRFNDEQQGYFTYRYQDDTYSDISSAMAPYVTPGESQISSITPMYVHDTRDDVFDPNRGVYDSMSMQIGGGILGGDYNYMKFIYDGRIFIPSIWKFVLGMHIRIGDAFGYSYSDYGKPQVPLVEKFYAGGTDTIRGYDERVLGPGQAGGDFTIITNIEYKFKVIERMLTLVAFYDSGNCWTTVNDVDWKNPYLYPSTGAGIRFTIPGTVMLIRLDWGFPLDRNYPKPGGRIDFNIGNIF